MPEDTRKPSDFTKALHDLRAQEVESAEKTERLLAIIYDELRQQADRLMRRERADHTLQPTALVHEAYLKLVDQPLADWEDRAHFIGIATRAMRQILVDHARGRAAAKRGGGWNRVTLDESVFGGSSDFEMLAIDEALTNLSRLDERAARVAELRMIGGLSVKETAHVLGVSARTVDNDWALARMWLSRALREDDPE